MSVEAPFLLDEEDARHLCAGVNPAKVAAPIYFGGRKRWARAALEKAIAEKAGLDAPKVEQSSAYDAWKREE